MILKDKYFKRHEMEECGNAYVYACEVTMDANVKIFAQIRVDDRTSPEEKYTVNSLIIMGFNGDKKPSRIQSLLLKEMFLRQCVSIATHQRAFERRGQIIKDERQQKECLISSN